MSDLLKLVDTHHVALGKGSLHLFKRLPLSAFVPTFDDLQLIEKWLLSPLVVTSLPLLLSNSMLFVM
jgi:hypothetical protein